MRQLIAAAFIATCALISGGHTRDIPTRPVTMVVRSQRVAQPRAARVVADHGPTARSTSRRREHSAGGMTGRSGSRRLACDGYHRAGHRGTHAQNQTLYKRPPTMRRLISPLLCSAGAGADFARPASQQSAEDLAYLKRTRERFPMAQPAPACDSPGCALLNAAIGVTSSMCPIRTGPAMRISRPGASIIVRDRPRRCRRSRVAP